MRLMNKENSQKKINLTLDRKNCFFFLNKVTELSKQCEHNSNPKKLNYSVVVNSVRIPYMNCKGLVSRVIDPNGRITHIGMFDWDNILESLLLDETRYLFSLLKNPIYIFKTSEKKDCNGQMYGNYMGITLLKRPFFDWIDINKQLHTDIAHSIVAKKYRYKCFVLRMSNKNIRPKPEFKCIIDGGQTKFKDEISNGHKQFLEIYFPEIKKINKKYTFRLDKNKLSNVFFTQYKTASD